MRRLYVARLLNKALCLTLFSIFVSCNHGEGGKENPEVEDLKDLTIKTLNIKDADGKLGSVIFKGESVTINKGDIIIQFKEEGAPKYPENHESFTFSKKFPITVQKGKEEKLKISMAKTNKYNVWEKEVSIRCTNLEVLNIKPPIKVHGENVKDGVVKLKEGLKKVEAGDVKVSFLQSDAPTHRFEGLPIELKAGESKKFKIVTEATAKYEKFEAEVTIVCEAQGEATELTLKKITVYDVDVENDSVTIPLEHASVAKENIKIYFSEDDWSKEVLCEPQTLSLAHGETKSLKVYVNATAKYKKFERTINVKRQEKKALSVKTLKIRGFNASGKSVTISEENVAKTDVDLVFLESDAPSEFNVSPQPFTLNKGETKPLTISTEETEKYKAWSIEVSVKRIDENTPKTIDDVIEALKGQLSWVDSYVDSNVVLLTEVAGFAGSTVEWVESSDSDYFNISGEVHRDIVNVQVELKARVTWNGESKEVTFSTTVERIKKITEAGVGGPGGNMTWDFSEENVLKLGRDGKATHVWEIKSVDVKKKHLVAQLKKKAFNGNLVDIIDYAKLEIDSNFNRFNSILGDTYLELKKKAIITWQDLKVYVLGLGSNLPTTDEDLFEFAKRQFLGYGGTLAEFNALSDDERTKIVKDSLDSMKLSYCIGYGIPTDTPDEQLLERLKEKITKLFTFLLENIRHVLFFSYELRDTSFLAITSYDNNKKWNEQIGSYSFDNGTMQIIIRYRKISDTESDIELVSNQGSGSVFFHGVYQASQSDSFTLKNIKNEVAVLHCSISDAKDGKFTLTTTGEFEGTFQMNLVGREIEHL